MKKIFIAIFCTMLLLLNPLKVDCAIKINYNGTSVGSGRNLGISDSRLSGSLKDYDNTEIIIAVFNEKNELIETKSFYENFFLINFSTYTPGRYTVLIKNGTKIFRLITQIDLESSQSAIADVDMALEWWVLPEIIDVDMALEIMYFNDKEQEHYESQERRYLGEISFAEQKEREKKKRN